MKELTDPEWEIVPTEAKDIAEVNALIEAENRVEQIRNLKDLIMSIYYRSHEIRAIFAYNHQRGVRMEEMGPYEAPMDYKLNQLDGDIMKLRGIFGLTEERECKKSEKNYSGGKLKKDLAVGSGRPALVGDMASSGSETRCTEPIE